MEKYPDYGKSQIQAEKVLQENDIISVPIPIDQIAMNYGLQIFISDFNDSTESGLLSPKEKKVYINRKDSIARRRFTLAHELGHFLMHKGLEEIKHKEFIERRSPISGEKPWYEKEADAFAAHLLVPIIFLKKEGYIFSTKENIPFQKVYDLSKKYDVSIDVIGYQINRMNREKQ